MAADNIHASIGNKMKDSPKIPTYGDYVTLCENAGNNIEAVELDIDDIFDIKKGNRARSTKKVVIPSLSEIVEIEFRNGRREMFVKKSFNDEQHTAIDFLKPKVNINDLICRRKKRRGVT